MEVGPIRDNKAGNTNKPWNNPNMITNKNILKNTENTCESLPANKRNAINVEKPPLRTAKPMSKIAALALSFLVPETVKKAWQMCTE